MLVDWTDEQRPLDVENVMEPQLEMEEYGTADPDQMLSRCCKQLYSWRLILLGVVAMIWNLQLVMLFQMQHSRCC
jgi:hypothetical protein